MKPLGDQNAIDPPRFRNRNDAEAKVCRAIASLGMLAGVDVAYGRGPADMDASLIEAAHESYFDDPHFLGGPCCFAYAETDEDADELLRLVDPILSGLSNYIRTRSVSETVQQAEGHVAMVQGAFAWLRKRTRRRSP